MLRLKFGASLTLAFVLCLLPACGEVVVGGGKDGRADVASDRGADIGSAGDASADAGLAPESDADAGRAADGGDERDADAARATVDAGPEGRDAACRQLAVDLRSASAFAVLAGATITSTGPTTVTGDVGVSPGTAITGFPPGAVVGAQHAGDPTAAHAIADLTTAYNDAKARTLCPVSVAGDLSGQTLAPGLYESTSSLSLSTGNLVLDGQGDGDAVFIFQMATTLTTTAGRRVTLANGAQASHVYWQVGTSATLGTTSAFVGTILADQSITLMTGATLNGRALARIAAVTLDSNPIVAPAP